VTDAQQLPADPTSVEALSRQGLRFAAVDHGDDAALRSWLEANARGFHESRFSEERNAELLADIGYRRVLGVWDDALAEPSVPVATVASWPLRLTVPDGAVDAWAIAEVTVAPTHRRRGIARALLEGELRTAAEAGVPLAALTVSEATIYGRFGFGPATEAVDLVIDPRRLRWTGGEVPGRTQFVSRELMLEHAPEILGRIWATTPGEVSVSGLLLTGILGVESNQERLRELRIVRYDDADGTPQGFVVYRLQDNEDDFTSQTLRVLHLAAATDDAYAALWRHVLEVDLVGEVRAWTRSVDEPLPWLVSNQRAVRTVVRREHLWLRVLDPVAALAARRYAAPGRLVLEIEDPLGFADGTVLLEVGDDGAATVTPLPDARPDDVPVLALDVAALASIYLGATPAATLKRAGRVVERTPGAAAAADRLLSSPVTPWLSIWF
jgi:predicted acetyltransferase